MRSQTLLFVGAGLTFLWGVAHLFPTRNVVRDFGELTADNRRIITMEWITEGVALMFIGVLVALVTLVDRASPVSVAVYWATSGCLVVLAIVSAFTGARNAFLPFKLCPWIFSVSAAVIVLGGCA